MELKLGLTVFHENIYWGKEPMKIVGIREKEVELEGDYSGGTHGVCQKDWQPIEGVLFSKTAVSGSVTPSELSSIIMMVSDDGKIWKKRNVIALHNGRYVTSEGIRTCLHTDEEFTSINYWRFAKII
jgi:hypothetical protein